YGINGRDDAGDLWECPDLSARGDQHVLMCCPQGVPREKERYLNTYPAVWMSGDFAYHRAAFAHGELHELDAGFELAIKHISEPTRLLSRGFAVVCLINKRGGGG
ncbi:hypothetical protein D3H39_27370, partial [Citrobacter portucalensis]